MRKSVALFAVLLSLLPGALPAEAQQPAVSQVSVSGVKVEDGALVASLSVVDGTGNPVRGMTAQAVTATVDGQPLSVSSLVEGTDKTLPLALIVVLDVSGSMEGAPLQTAKEAIRPLLQSLQPGDRATLISFGSTVTTTVPLTGDTAALTAGLNGLVARGSTALYGAVAAGASAAGAATEPRKAVVLLTDGEEFGNVSGVTREQALAAARATTAPFFVVAFGNEADEAFLRAVSEQGAGGQFLSSKTTADLGAIYASVSNRLRLQYTLRLPLPPGLKGGAHRLKVTAGGASGDAGFELAAAVAPAAAFSPLTGAIGEPTALRLENVPAGATVWFSVDGNPASAEAGGRSLLLDPWMLDPAQPHTVSADIDVGGARSTAQLRFDVKALPPKLTSPESLAGLTPGTTVRATVQAQPGTAPMVVFLVDEHEAARDETEPFEWTIPGSFAAGNHQLSVRVENSAGSDARTFVLTVPPRAGGGSSGWMIYAVAGIAAAVALTAAAWLMLRWQQSRGPRSPRPESGAPIDVSGVGEQLSGWAEKRRGGKSRRKPPPPAPAPTGRGWGYLTVLRGQGAGNRYELKEERELVGRGKFCSVRLPDPGVEEAHFVITPDGRLFASTPACTIEVDGEGVRTTTVDDGSAIAVGNTLLKFSRAHAGQLPLSA
jgi:VWFA-related protein